MEIALSPSRARNLLPGRTASVVDPGLDLATNTIMPDIR